MRQDIIAQTLEGVAALLRKGLDPEKLIEQIATPGGCTEQGVLELERCHNSRDLQSAFEKAQRHIEQL